jgi:hypothetical protein
MVAPIETLKAKFPRSAEALKKHHALVDKLVPDLDARKQLKASMAMLVLVVGEEAAGIGRHIDLIRGLFGK